MKTCNRHGGPWGEDETCENCTDEDGNVLTTAKNPDTFEELMQKVLEILPDAVLEERGGEIIIGTCLYETSDGNLHSTLT